MSNPVSFSAQRARFMNRVHARLAIRSKAAKGFVLQPEPRTIGSFARGRQLMAGNCLFAGYLIEAPNGDIWNRISPDAAYESELHGFAWLDDLAAVGEGPARGRAQNWLWDWIERYGKGTGPGWTPDLTGRRLIRWINHAIFLLRGRESTASDAFFLSLAQQTRFLSKRWQSAAPGLPRFEALTGLIYAGTSLEGMEELAEPAIKALARECTTQISAQGGLPTRNPEELLEVFTLLTWAAASLGETGKEVPPEHLEAIERIAPSLRTLRHADGGLARFHGGGRGLEGWLDHALAASHVKTRQPDGLSMGYARLSAGRTSVIVDANRPPEGIASYNGHASTLAFELTSGRRPLIVNCGSGQSFGGEWRRAGRATPSHSTLCLGGSSSAQLAGANRREECELLVDGPRHVPSEISSVPDGVRFEAGHDGYVSTYGLNHVRILEMTFSGRGIAGEDMLAALDVPAQKRFDAQVERSKSEGVSFDIRFHLHPDVDAALDLGGAAVTMTLKSGESWVFRHDGTINLSLESSVYMEKGRLKPRAGKQIVLSGRAIEYATSIRWSLSKAQDTAVAVRDLNQDGPDAND